MRKKASEEKDSARLSKRLLDRIDRGDHCACAGIWDSCDDKNAGLSLAVSA